MTRFEAAALPNACLDRVTEVTDELRRLMAEFETELAILKVALTASKPRPRTGSNLFSTTTSSRATPPGLLVLLTTRALIQRSSDPQLRPASRAEDFFIKAC